VPCPKCGGDILKRHTKKGKNFYGCANYPACDFVSWDKPVPGKCPKCGGILVQRMGQNGEYTTVVYDRQAQQFILDNLDAIIALNAEPLHENQGKPWSPEEDDYLRRAVSSGVEVRDMSSELKRTRAAIRARLEKLGLTNTESAHGTS
jgi:hypothetical protein